MSNVYAIISNQFAPHPNTESCAEKHSIANYRRPFSCSQLRAFEGADKWRMRQDKTLILDSGCGTGDSTLWLAKQFPDCAIIGVDQSLARLEKAEAKRLQHMTENVFFVRARLEDFWRLALQASWPIRAHHIFYPNPWPKAEHLSRRWHGHPVFPDLLALSPFLEIRSNWLLYLQEFSLATEVVTGLKAHPQVLFPLEGVSAFETKYRAAQVECYLLRISLPRETHSRIRRRAC